MIVKRLAMLALDQSSDLLTLTEKVCTCKLAVVIEHVVENIALIVKYSVSLMIFWIALWFRLALLLVNQVDITAKLVIRLSDGLLDLFWRAVEFAVPVLAKTQAPAGALRLGSRENFTEFLTILGAEEDVYSGCSVLVDIANLGSLKETIQAARDIVRSSPTVVWHLYCDPDRVDVFKAITTLVTFAVIRFNECQCELVIHRKSDKAVKALTSGVKLDRSIKLKRRLSDPCLLTRATKLVGSDTNNPHVRESFRM